MLLRDRGIRARRSRRDRSRSLQTYLPLVSGSMSRKAWLAGSSMMALVLSGGGHGALARPIGFYGATTSAPMIASDAATAAAQQAATTAKQTQSALTRALQSMQAVQAAGRSAAQAAGTSRTLPQVVVPNGLAPGGLQVAPSGTWSNAGAPTQSTSGGQTNVNIQQTAPQAILSWTTFNVGAQTTVNFSQQASTWTALNRVVGNLGPSQILGNINAPGQVLVINQNGIIFGGASQINVGSLIASTADITNQQFSTNGIYSNPAGSVNAIIYTPSFTGAGGKIIVEPGAQITTSAPASATAGGGFVLMMGTEVDNAGSITTPMGQAQFAAGDDFILRPGYGTTDGNQYSTTRGNEIAPVIHAGSGSGGVDNTGLVFAQQGDITLAGHTIVQDGILLSTTSVNQRGTIHLLNSASDATGSVTLTGDSLTAVLPETADVAAVLTGLDSNATALNSERDGLIAASGVNALATRQFNNLSTLADRKDLSRIEIVTGGLVDFQSGSQTVAQGGQISVSAGQRVFAESGATLDVSGSQDVMLPMSANDLSVSIQGNELRDSPANRDSGTLINANVWVDARDLVLVPAGTGGYATDRYYTGGGLLEVSGYLNNTGHTIGEWTAVGGTITLSAPQVVAQAGSTFNIAGGSVQYQSGYLQETNLLGSDGRIYNINNAPSDLTYVGVANGFTVLHYVDGKLDKALTEVYLGPFNRNTIWQDGYTVGRDAGSLILSTPTSLFEGTIVADVIAGQQQITARPAGVTDGYKLTQGTLPLAGMLALGQYNASGLFGAYGTNVIFQSGSASVADSLSASGALPSNVVNTAYFNTDPINSSGLGGLGVATNGAISVNSPLSFASGAQVKLVAPIVDVAADVTARSGSITITNVLNGGSLTTPAGGAQLTLAAGVAIDAHGSWVNGLTDPDNLLGLAWLNGGNVTFDSSQNVTLAAGSTIDVSSGAAVLSTGKTKGGTGGNVTLIANDPSGGRASTVTAPLILDATIRAYGVSGGGTFKLATAGVLIAPAGTEHAPEQVLLTPDFFSAGFSNYDVNGYGGISVAAGTQVNVVVPVYQLTNASYGVPTGSDPASALQLWLPPLYLEDPVKAQLTQRTGASLALRSTMTTSVGASGGDLIVGQGAAINVDPGRSVVLDAFGQITVDGAITAHSGTIKVINEASYTTLAGRNFDAAENLIGRSIWIGGDAVLDVSGQAHIALDLVGRAYGVAGNGGTIQIGGVPGTDVTSGALISTSSFVVIRAGAVLDASGASAVIDPNAGTRPGSVELGAPFAIAGSGGSIALDSSSGIYNDGMLRAPGGGAGAAGGSLSITLETPVYAYSVGSNVPTAAQVPSVMTITQGAQASGLPDNLVPGTNPSALKFGQAQISADAIAAGGFDNLSLFSRDAFLFAGNVVLKAGQRISLYQGSFADTVPTASVTIAAPYVFFGGHTAVKADFAIDASLSLTPSSASTQATFNVAADLIDFQNDVQFLASGQDNSTGDNFVGFQNANFVSQGDIRFLAPVTDSSRLLTPASFTFTAAQLYPVTGAYAVVSAGNNITVGRINDADPAMPMSVFGRLLLAAKTIQQGGIIRAPLGVIGIGAPGNTLFGGISATTSLVQLLPGSITSVSADGLTIPYGGTTDGLSYNYAGSAIQPVLSTVDIFGRVQQGVSLAGKSIDVQTGATLDLSGGGALTGHGFISGRGGSVDVLTTPLVNANPTNTFSAAGDKVYAIVPSYSSGYAPVAAENGAGDPMVGQQITIPAGVPGLPAGTYTLLPSNYALLPGAYRVELGSSTSPSQAAFGGALGNGSYSIAGYKSVANTSVRDALPTQLIVTAADAVRHYSQYNEQGYSDFMVASAALFGQPRPVLPADAKTLTIQFVQPDPGSTTRSFNFDGTALFQPAAGGFGGTAVVGGGNAIEVDAPGAAPTPGFGGISLDVADLDAIGASRLMLGGFEFLQQGTTQIDVAATTGSLFVRSGVALSAGEVVLTANGGVTVESGATISTIGQGPAPFDSSNGYVYSSQSTALVLSNGDLNFVSATGNGAISIGAGASLYSGGTLVFATNGVTTIDPTARYGTKSLQLVASNINIGDGASLGATVPSGIEFSQAVFDQLVAGAGAGVPAGVPALEQLVLGASKSVNFYGTTGLDAAGTNIQLILNTPGIYGYGTSTDVASLKAGTLVWGGVGNATLPVVTANSAGTGLGTLDISASTIILGYADRAVPNNQVSLNRSTYGFSAVNLAATQQIVSNYKGSLSVYQAPTLGGVLGKSGTGGDLNMTTPLLTSAAGSIMAYTAGGAINVTGAASSSAQAGSGAEIDLTGNSVAIATAVVLPSGKLVVNATGDITIASGARLDLSGQPTTIQDKTVHGFGGDIIVSSVQGNVTQQAGSVIDVSATGSDAGSLSITAVGGSGGQVSLGGTLVGASTPVAGDAVSHSAGSFTVNAQTLASGSAAGLNSDFAALNQSLDAGGFFAARSFDLKQGNLTIGSGVKAHAVTVSVDGGSLTVNGTIDANGVTPGIIRLASRDDFELTASGMLDAHGTVLQLDSYRAPIEAKNRGTIELASTQGTLRLDTGSSMDVSVTSPSGALQGIFGQININVPRGTIGSATSAGDETSGDIRIDASGSLNITGAQSIAVNGFWTYSPTDAHGTIMQDNGSTDPVSASTGYLGLNQIDTRSQTFMGNALANANLQARLAGLKSYTNAFHLRPGIEIDGRPSAVNPDGDLTVAGDIDLSGFRYTSLNPNFQKTGVYGSGEPGALVIRASGNLDIVGSISDGFSPAPATPDDNSWILLPGQQTGNIETLLPITLNAGTTFPNTAGLSLRYDIQINAATISANAVIPLQVTLSAAVTLPAGTQLAAPVYDSANNLLYAAGTVMASATTLPVGTQLGAGSVMPGNINVTAMTWKAGATLGVFAYPVMLSANAPVPFEGIIPTGTNVVISGPSEPTRPTNAAGTQGSIAAIAPMLPQGDLSWSLRLVSGADLGAADTRTVKPVSTLQASGASGNLTLVDVHLGYQPAASIQVPQFEYYAPGLGPQYTTDPNAYGCIHYGGCTPAGYVTKTTYPQILTAPTPSVLRTGTGNLDLIAGGSFNEQSLFGVYTAGTQSQPLAADGSTAGVTAANTPFNAPRGLAKDGTLLGGTSPDKATAASASYKAWYPEHGGDLLLSAQGNVSGYISQLNGNQNQSFDSDAVGQWLWHQGGAIAGQSTAWWINFGTYALTSTSASGPVVVGFQGIGTLGGGNLTVIAGGNAGTMGGNSGLDLAVASTGRVLTDGTVVQTGGGDLTLRVGGVLNPQAPINTQPDVSGAITDLRGDTSIQAGSIGVITLGLGNGTAIDPSDPRPLDYRGAELSSNLGGPVVVPGDGTVTISTRGDLVLGGAGDAAMLNPVDQNGTPYTSGGVSYSGGGNGSFTLWTPTTAIDLYSAGGNLSPGASPPAGGYNQNNGNDLYPATLTAVAASGNLYFSPITSPNGGNNGVIELAPSPTGQLALLAAGSIYGEGAIIAMSGADMSSLATPRNPVFGLLSGTGLTNASPNSAYVAANSRNSPIAFGPDTPTTNLHGNDSQPGLVYAGSDIVNLEIGYINAFTPYGTSTPLTWYYGAKPFRIIAGRDIIGGAVPNTGIAPKTVNFILNDNKDDISVIRAGRDIINDSVTIGGPGLLDLEAGRNLYQGYLGTLESIGPLVNIDPSDRSGGAGISVLAGVGANGPDYTDFAKLYFDPANQLPSDGTPLAGSGKVAKTYDDELYNWLTQRFSSALHFVYGGKTFVFTGSKADALAFFLSLPAEQQGVFVREVYYDELTAGGREYNDRSSSRYGSYLRGRDAIAALFPDKDANGHPLTYTGNITMFSGRASYNGQGNLDTVFNPADITRQFDAGIRTDFGGAIQMLTPGGQTIIGVEGLAPTGNAGLLTLGSGDIDIYSLGSVLLGQSRIMTTFGGNILVWSAEGDINAGRGSKTTVVFTPPRRIYDNYGNVTLAPQVPSSGAGIATLKQIPQVAAGDVDLIAPLGTIDAGEAGIRVSGNVNLAALQVVNAANIQVQGTATGLPTVPAPTGALSLAANSTAATQQAAAPTQPNNSGQPSVIIVEVLGYGGGDGADTPNSDREEQRRRREEHSYNSASPIQVVGAGSLNETADRYLTESEREALRQ